MPKPNDDAQDKPPAPPTPAPDPSKLISPDWSKAIDDLTAKVESLVSEKEELKTKTLNLTAEIDKLRAAAPTPVKKEIDKAFSPWDWFFGE